MQHLARHHIHLEHTYLIGLVLPSGIDELHLVAAVHAAVDYLEVGNDSPERIEHRVEDERLQRSLLVSLGTRNTIDHCIKYLLHSQACLSAGQDNLLVLAAKQFHYLILDLFGHRVRHVALVHHGDDFQIMFDGHIEVADSLGLHTLCGIHHQQSAFASGNASAHLVTEVHMSRSIDEIERILPIGTLVIHLYGMTLDGDTALALQIHVVEHLPLGHFDGVGVFQQTVSQSALAVVDVGNDAEVPNMLHKYEILYVRMVCQSWQNG